MITMHDAHERKPHGSRVLTVDQLMEKFGKGRETIKRWCKNKQLPAFKQGKSWFVHEDALEQHMASAVQSRCHLRRPQGEQQ